VFNRALPAQAILKHIRAAKFQKKSGEMDLYSPALASGRRQSVRAGTSGLLVSSRAEIPFVRNHPYALRDGKIEDIATRATACIYAIQFSQDISHWVQYTGSSIA